MASFGIVQILLGIAGAFVIGLPAGSGVGIATAVSAGTLVGYFNLSADETDGLAVAVAVSDGPEEPVEVRSADEVKTVGKKDVSVPAVLPEKQVDAAIPSDPIGDFIAVKDKICACKDMNCVAALQPAMAAAGKGIGKNPAAVQKRAGELQSLGKELSACMQRIAGAMAKP
ncbi:MAG: hypothetical protein ACI9OJ_004094 [Myxococcota bacterium]|jgi:hypothetical protein